MPSAAVTDRVTGAGRPLWRVLHAEWTKLCTVRSTAWLAIAIVAFTVMLGAMVTASVDTSQCPAPTECFEDTTKLSLTGVWLGQAVVAVLAVLTVTTENGTRMIQTTLAVSPRRVTVLLAKATAVTAIVVSGSTLGVLASVVAGRFILRSNGFTDANGYPPLSLTDGPTLRAAVGTVLYLGLIALLSLGVGAIACDTAGALTTMLTLLYVLPVLAELVSDPEWSERFQKLTPTTAGLAVQATQRLDELPIGPWAGLGVLAAYAAAAMLGGTLLFRARDA
jgi:ABC-2 type transport system permease protein